MSDTYEINERNQVVSYTSGRKCTDTRAWRDATELELQQQEQIEQLERELAEAKNKIERQGARIKYLEGATNHATGTPLTKALEQLDEMRIDRDEWKAVSEGQLLDLIDKVAQLERELAEERQQRDMLVEIIKSIDPMPDEPIDKAWTGAAYCEISVKEMKAIREVIAEVEGGKP